MLSLTYVSMPVNAVANRANVLDDLRAVSAASNSALDITGILLATPLYFAASLEGPDRNIGTVLGRIRADERHDGLRVIRRSAVEQRRYPAWRMIRIEGGHYCDSGITPLLAAAHRNGGQDATRKLDWLLENIGLRAANPLF